MIGRPDYIRCVVLEDTMPDGKKTWCGVPSYSYDKSFVDVTHAALNGKQEGRLVVCPDCIKEITSALNNGHD